MSERDAFNQDIEIKGMNFKVLFARFQLNLYTKKMLKPHLALF